MPWFIDDYLPFWYMMAFLVFVIGPLVAISNPQWFKRRQRYATGHEIVMGQEPEYEEWPDFRERERCVLDRPIVPVEYVPFVPEPEQSAIQIKHKLPTVTVDTAEDEDDSVQDEERAREFLEVLDRFGSLAPPIEELSVVAPSFAPQAVPQRRSDYKFCVGSRADTKENVFFPLGNMFFARKVGGGKSNALGIVMGQALEQGIQVWYMSVGYAPVDEDGLDIEPLVQRCAKVAIDPHAYGLDALAMLREACDLIDLRKDVAIKQKVAYHDPVLIIGEELKALQASLNLLVKLKRPGCENVLDEASGRMEYILSTGRKYNVNYAIAAQDGQSQTVKMSQGTLTNMEIRLAHPSLDLASKRNLLPQGYDLKHHPLPVPTTPYQWYLILDFGMGMTEVRLIDVPLLTNATIQKYIRGVPLVSRQEPKPAPAALHPVSLRDEGRGVVTPPLEFAPGTQVTPAEAYLQIVEPLTPIPNPQAFSQFVPQPTWKAEHVKAAAWLTKQRAEGGKVTNKALAEILYGKSDGRYNTNAGKVLAQVYQLLGITDNERDESEDSENENS